LKAPEATAAALAALPIVPQEDGEPVFAEPWQAQVFAMALALHRGGLFTWKEWADRLAVEIQAAQASGDPDLGDTYYDHWLATLEKLVVERGILSTSGLVSCRDAWDRAARATPHGEPIVLGRERRN
jgi:nitrile hydratase accessory protein